MTYTMIVIDDLRSCKNESILLDADTDLRYARTSAEGIQLLQELIEAGVTVDEVWLDHDLGPDDSKYGFDTIMPVVAYLEELGNDGHADRIGSIMIHTANTAMVPVMQAALKPYYRFVFSVNASDFFVSNPEW